MNQILLHEFYSISSLLSCVGLPLAAEVEHHPELMFLSRERQEIPIEKAYALLQKQMRDDYPAARDNVHRELAERSS